MAGRSNRNWFSSSPGGGAGVFANTPFLIGPPTGTVNGVVGVSVSGTANRYIGFVPNSVPSQLQLAGFDQTGTVQPVGTITLFCPSGMLLGGSGGSAINMQSGILMSSLAGIVVNGIHLQVRGVTGATYTAVETDDFIACTGAVAITVTLPSSFISGKVFFIKNRTSPLSTVTISAAANIDGAGTQTLTTANSVLRVLWDGTTWNII